MNGGVIPLKLLVEVVIESLPVGVRGQTVNRVSMKSINPEFVTPANRCSCFGHR